ncbi:MAG: hypothetical protein COV01_02690 [Candidatus Taylorbacteria bacterium CG10_big_fil_rev_8_21_14_0_10_41_48]|uniref:Uncharacterized protein n=1 Tax=Candidatus Taylorbacteria bacterium CG10_big_fil_rev_8_21_14_0_10_41_48 TaxID=1975024 RepID=A0A2M8LBL8_9BACT|nr:MAG: hypothetical protein COV01_02690 [Candidatus Taylorbacteria bacterium CG10_big_fil_rev_8_21_14_0_10_41_48]
MSFISYIEKLREKSESERRKISIGVAFVVTIFVAVVWIFTITSNISPGESSVAVNTNQKVNAYDDIKKGWDSLVENMSTLFSGTETHIQSTETTSQPVFDVMEGVPADTVEIDTIDTISQ